MREIDPIRNPSEAILSAALNRLAKGSARQAPPDVGARLVQEFRRHHVSRRRATAAVISLAACLVLATALFLTLRLSVDNAPSGIAKRPAPIVAPSPGAGTETAPEQNASRHEQRPAVNRASGGASTANAQQDGFMALSVYDPAMPPSEVKIVRVEITGAELRLVGAPVAEDLSDRRLLADIVVANDGTPYAVRLVR